MLTPFTSTFWSEVTVKDLLAVTTALFIAILFFAGMAIQTSTSSSLMTQEVTSQVESNSGHQVVLRTFSGR